MSVTNGGITNSNHRICLNQVKDPKGIYKHSCIAGIVLWLCGRTFYDKHGGFLDKESTIRYLKRNSAAFGDLSQRINALTNSDSAGTVKKVFKCAKQTIINPHPPIARSKSESESKSKAKSIEEPQSTAESESKAISEATAESESESESKSVSESTAESKSESESKSVSESTAESKSESESKSVSESTAESETKSKAKSIEESKERPKEKFKAPIENKINEKDKKTPVNRGYSFNIEDFDLEPESEEFFPPEQIVAPNTTQVEEFHPIKERINSYPYNPNGSINESFSIKSDRVEINANTYNPNEFTGHIFSFFDKYDDLKFRFNLNAEEQLFMKHPPLEGNKALLQATIEESTRNPPTKIVYHTVNPGDIIDHLWSQKVVSLDMNTTFDEHDFKYNQKWHCYLLSAHPTSLGGAYRFDGFLQEERMFSELPSLAYLDFMTEGRIHPSIDINGKQEPQPFIVENISAAFDLSEVPLRKIHEMSIEEIKKGVKPLESSPPVDILGLAPIDWKNFKVKKYSLEQVKDLFGAAFLGFVGENVVAKKRGMEKAIVHTASWGMELKNNQNMMIVIQCLAAKMAGVDLVFHGVKENTPLSKGKIEQLIKIIDSEVNKGVTLQGFFENILKKQEGSAGRQWQPPQ